MDLFVLGPKFNPSGERFTHMAAAAIPPFSTRLVSARGQERLFDRGPEGCHESSQRFLGSVQGRWREKGDIVAYPSCEPIAAIWHGPPKRERDINEVVDVKSATAKENDRWRSPCPGMTVRRNRQQSCVSFIRLLSEKERRTGASWAFFISSLHLHSHLGVDPHFRKDQRRHISTKVSDTRRPRVERHCIPRPGHSIQRKTEHGHGFSGTLVMSSC